MGCLRIEVSPWQLIFNGSTPLATTTVTCKDKLHAFSKIICQSAFVHAMQLKRAQCRCICGHGPRPGFHAHHCKKLLACSHALYPLNYNAKPMYVCVKLHTCTWWVKCSSTPTGYTFVLLYFCTCLFACMPYILVTCGTALMHLRILSKLNVLLISLFAFTHFCIQPL